MTVQNSIAYRYIATNTNEYNDNSIGGALALQNNICNVHQSTIQYRTAMNSFSSISIYEMRIQI